MISTKGFWWLTLSIGFGFTLPILIQDAMFQDAVLYSAVSHNMSVGWGSFWFPQYSTLNLEGIPSFHEQPPLFFGLMSLIYKVFGSSYYVERVFVFILFLLNMFLIHTFWRNIFSVSERLKSMSWLPVLFWVLFPVCFWSFRHNMIENLMSIFILLSVIFAWKSLQGKSIFTGLVLSGLFIFLATFSKGVPGFFPVVVPFLFALIFRNVSIFRSIVYSAFLLCIPLAIYGILLYFPEPRESLSIYFYERLLGRVDHMPTTANRFFTLRVLFFEMIPQFLIIIPIIFLLRKKWDEYIPEVKKEAIFFFTLGLLGTLPLMLTMVQKMWYIVPALPFFAIGTAALTAPFLYEILLRLRPGTYTILSRVFMVMLVVVLGVTASKTGQISREKETLTDVYKIGKVVPPFSTLTVPESQYDQYNFILQGFLVRYFHISLSPYQNYDFYLALKDEKIRIPSGYKPVDIGLVKYNLYKR